MALIGISSVVASSRPTIDGSRSAFEGDRSATEEAVERSNASVRRFSLDSLGVLSDPCLGHLGDIGQACTVVRQDGL